MKVAIEETDRRRAVQEPYNVEHGIEPTTIIKGIHDINDRLRAVAETTVVYSSERRAATLEAADKAEVERLVARMEAEMKQAAKELEFERAAAIRDEIQQVRLRVLEQDASVVVQRAAERAAKDALLPAKERAAAHRPGQRAGAWRPGARGHGGHGASRRRGAGPGARRRAARGGRPVGRRRGAVPRASATSTTTRTARAGRRAGSTGRPGT